MTLPSARENKNQKSDDKRGRTGKRETRSSSLPPVHLDAVGLWASLRGEWGLPMKKFIIYKNIERNNFFLA